MKRFFVWIAAAALVISAMHSVQRTAFAQNNAATPPPPPPRLGAGAVATPRPQATIKLPISSKATPTPAPPKDTADKRVGISGVWELQIQHLTGTVYTHFNIIQKDNVLTGQYLDAAGKRYPLTGLIDGKTVRVIVTVGTGATLVFTATQDSFTDMIGVLEDAVSAVPFSAAYRPKYKWLENVTPGPGQGIP